MIIYGHRVFHWWHTWIYSESKAYVRYDAAGTLTSSPMRYSKRLCWCGVAEHLEGRQDGLDTWVRII